MGITVHYKLGQSKEYVKSTLDYAEKGAEKLQEFAENLKILFIINRKSDNELWIDMGNCETLIFNFENINDIIERGKKGWDYQHSVLNVLGKENVELKHLDKNLMYTAKFCKTQYANKIEEHIMVVEIIKLVASRCHYVDVNDEGNYYHSGKIEDGIEAIDGNGKIIANVFETLE